MSSPYPIPEIKRDESFRPKALPPSSRPPSPQHDPSRPSTPLPPKQSIVAGPIGSQPTKQKKKLPDTQHAQVEIDQFWAKFTAPIQGKPYIVLPDNAHALRAARNGASTGKNALASYGEARATCEAKVAKIVQECRRLNIKYRDPHFDIEDDFRRWSRQESPYADCLMGLNEIRTDLKPMSVKRVEDIFEKPQFFIDGATASDVRQGKEGDCWFMSALCTLSNKEGLIQKVCVARDEQVGIYGFVFNRDGEWISEVVDDKLYLIKEDFDDSTLERNRWLELQNRTMPADEWKAVMQTGSRALYFAQCAHQDETWLSLLEKAYAKAHGDFSALENGFVGEGIEDLTGGVTTELFSTDILDKDKFWREELMNVNKQFLFGCGQMGGAYGQRSGIIEKHAYSVMEAREVNGKRLVKLRNPWGAGGEWEGPWADGSAEWTPEWMHLLDHKFGDDGVFWISYQDLLRNYQHFDRTRLFGPEWAITQQWTSVDVPWSVDYLETKFKVTIPLSGPVVIVLSQLDDRYFRGLEGQYDFHLQFRLHKDDEDEYIVRSNAAYYMKRSVSTELDLKAGVYWVLLKITAKRFDSVPSVADVVTKTSQIRREKLLSIGLSYDMAHAKGNFQELEAEKELKAKLEKKEKRKQLARKMHESRAKERKKAKLRAIRRDMKKNEKLMKRMAEEAEYRARQEADQDAARKLEEYKLSMRNSNGNNPVNGSGSLENAMRMTTEPSNIMGTPPLGGPVGGRRRDTLSVHPPNRHSTYPQHHAPDILVQRASVAASGKLSLSDISDDELSWDSELDGPDDFSDSEMLAGGPNGRSAEEDDADRDPWNAVCVVGLRVYSKDQEVEIEVVRGDDVSEFDSQQDPSSPIIGRKMLDVDDAAKDAVEAARTPVNSPISPTTVRGINVSSLEGMMGSM